MGEVIELKTKKLIKKVENAEYWMEKYYDEMSYKAALDALEVRHCQILKLYGKSVSQRIEDCEEFELVKDLTLWDRIFNWPY